MVTSDKSKRLIINKFEQPFLLTTIALSRWQFQAFCRKPCNLLTFANRRDNFAFRKPVQISVNKNGLQTTVLFITKIFSKLGKRVKIPHGRATVNAILGFRF
jgi:hypothetical protein